MTRAEIAKPQGQPAPVILVLGDGAALGGLGPDPPQIAGMAFAAIADLDAELLRRTCPDVVLSPLMAGAYDAIDVARALADLAFQGRYRVVCAGLPRPAAVLAELKQAAPGLDIDILRYPPTLRSAR